MLGSAQLWSGSISRSSPWWICPYVLAIDKHYLHRLRLPSQTAEKICTLVILGLATVESLQLRWDQLVVNLYALLHFLVRPALFFLHFCWLPALQKLVNYYLVQHCLIGSLTINRHGGLFSLKIITVIILCCIASSSIKRAFNTFIRVPPWKSMVIADYYNPDWGCLILIFCYQGFEKLLVRRGLNPQP